MVHQDMIDDLKEDYAMFYSLIHLVQIKTSLHVRDE